MRVIFFNIIFFLFLILLGEIFFGFWFSNENFGSYMRKERKKNWATNSNFNNKEYKFFYKRNFYGFRGEEFNPKDVKIIFEGGSTGNQRFTPEELTIVGLLNQKFVSENNNLKIYNASTDGKSLRGYINDFIYWFPKIKNLKPEYVIFYTGINDMYLGNTIDERIFDLHFQEQKIQQFKDYIKNNSFIYDKYKIIANKYFPKQTGNYSLNNNPLYNNFKYFDYEYAKNTYGNIINDEKNILLLKQFENRLLNLKKILDKNNVIPIFITQILYNGLEDKKLYLINEKLKEFAEINNFYVIKLDELINMEKNDFFDSMHTTPKGSEKIANTIYPFLKKILINK